MTQTRIKRLGGDNAALLGKIKTLCSVITELTHEVHTDNIVTMARGRRSGDESARAELR